MALELESQDKRESKTSTAAKDRAGIGYETQYGSCKRTQKRVVVAGIMLVIFVKGFQGARHPTLAISIRIITKQFINVCASGRRNVEKNVASTLVQKSDESECSISDTDLRRFVLRLLVQIFQENSVECLDALDDLPQVNDFGYLAAIRAPTLYLNVVNGVSCCASWIVVAQIAHIARRTNDYAPHLRSLPTQLVAILPST